MTKKLRQTSQILSEQNTSLNRENLYQLFEDRPFDNIDTLTNLTLFMRSGSLAKLLFIDELYREILQIPGQIFEFGTWLGGTTCLLENLRAIHEPYNHLRKINTFDTFSGYLRKYTDEDTSEVMDKILKEEVYTTPAKYSKYLESIMEFHNQNNVMSHIKKFNVIPGDVVKTLPEFLKNHPESMVSLAYFDLAMYQPTKSTLKQILTRSIAGTVIVLDELGHAEYAGETKVFYEFFPKIRYEIKKSKYLPDRSYIRIL